MRRTGTPLGPTPRRPFTSSFPIHSRGRGAGAGDGFVEGRADGAEDWGMGGDGEGWEEGAEEEGEGEGEGADWEAMKAMWCEFEGAKELMAE